MALLWVTWATSAETASELQKMTLNLKSGFSTKGRKMTTLGRSRYIDNIYPYVFVYNYVYTYIYIYMNIYTFPNLSGVWFKGPSLFRVPRSFSAFRPFSCASSPANWSKTYGGTALGIWMGFQKKTAEIPWKSREHPETMNLGVHWLMVCFCFVEFSVNLKRAKKLYIYIY